MASRVSWPHIKGHINNDTNGWLYDEPVIVILPEGFRRILIGLESLNWEATYRIDGYDFSDWDELQAIIHAGYYGLGDAMALKDLLAYMERLADAHERIADAVEAFELPEGEGLGAIADGLTGLVGLLDPRLAILIQLVDSIDNVLGGEYVPPSLGD